MASRGSSRNFRRLEPFRAEGAKKVPPPAPSARLTHGYQIAPSVRENNSKNDSVAGALRCWRPTALRGGGGGRRAARLEDDDAGVAEQDVDEKGGSLAQRGGGRGGATRWKPRRHGAAR